MHSSHPVRWTAWTKAGIGAPLGGNAWTTAGICVKGCKFVPPCSRDLSSASASGAPRTWVHALLGPECLRSSDGAGGNETHVTLSAINSIRGDSTPRMAAVSIYVCWQSFTNVLGSCTRGVLHACKVYTARQGRWYAILCAEILCLNKRELDVWFYTLYLTTLNTTCNSCASSYTFTLRNLSVSCVLSLSCACNCLKHKQSQMYPLNSISCHMQVSAYKT